MAHLEPSGAVERNKQIPALDGLRGLAILLVVCEHLKQTGAIPARYRLVNTLMGVGWSGVDLFFVLSGFLITLGLLHSKGSTNFFSAFYMRRVLRIFPLYYLAIVLTIICSIVFARYSPPVAIFPGAPDGPLFPTWLGWLSHILYVQNWWMPWREPSSRNPLGHFWSLAIEEQFYLIWPLCVLLLKPRRLFLTAIIVCCAVLGLRFLLAGAHVPALIIYRNTLTRSDSLMIGAICAMIVRNATVVSRIRRWLPIVAGLSLTYIAGVAVLIKSSAAQVYAAETLGFTAFALFFGCAVIAAYTLSGRRTWSDRFLSFRPLTQVGKYSYGIYVYHLPIVYLAKITFGANEWFGRDPIRGAFFLIGTTLSSYLVAALSYEFFEKRILTLKRFFQPHFGNDRSVMVRQSSGTTAKLPLPD